jgi:hypothetical protein
MAHLIARLLLSTALSLPLLPLSAKEVAPTRPIGVAQVDITPDYPIRLSGYLVRKTECQGVAQRLCAKALALGSDREGPALLITVDNCGVPGHIRDEVVRRLRKRVKPERIAVCSSHTHSAPCLAGNLPTLFGEPIPPEHQARIDRYTRELTDAIEQVALAALKDRRPGRLSFGRGTAGFAANRRTRGGPADHDLPVLVVTDPKGTLRAAVASYACHCTTLTGEFNQICGDWAGYAREYFQRDHPGATLLMALGCGGDANPNPRSSFELAQQHGQTIATAANNVLSGALAPVRGRLACRTKLVALPFDTLPTRAEWEAKAKDPGPIGYYAKYNLAKLERGEKLPSELPYLVQNWSFGDDLAMVFLPGEVVVDYSLRLKKEFDAKRIWVNAYANDVPCYIPSERVLKEGGYEGGGAMVYYDKPNRFAAGVEAVIVNAVHDVVPKSFLATQP